ncbi:MAG: excinuclease ABC subunit UvrA [Candidatus Latescibacterota bacterium]|nr:excinuclease ABC subunit UvrA [Candidatus Latescibacterota bacterium]
MIKNQGELRVYSANINNLKSVDVELPHGNLIVVSGVSGSGKTSFVYDVIYFEAQRRFRAAMNDGFDGVWFDHISPRARSIEGLLPTICLEQSLDLRHAHLNVAKIAHVYDLLVLLFVRAGQPHCLDCGARVHVHRFEEVYETVLGLPAGTKLSILAPLLFSDKSDVKELIEIIDRSGYRRVRINGDYVLLEDLYLQDCSFIDRVEVVVDRIVVKPESSRRLRGSLQAASEMANGRIVIVSQENKGDLTFSLQPSCTQCFSNFPTMKPSFFSFHSSNGACPECQGTGRIVGLTPEQVWGYESQSLYENLSPMWDEFGHLELKEKLNTFFENQKVDPDISPDLCDNVFLRRLWNGTRGRNSFIGLKRWLNRTAAKAQGVELEWFSNRFADSDCPECSGMRLRKEALSVFIEGQNIGEYCKGTIKETLFCLERIKCPDRAKNVQQQLISRLKTLQELGLGYLELGRNGEALSSGECQRLRLGAVIGRKTARMLYVLDEPSAGLHAKDTKTLIKTIQKLRDKGDTVIVIEHERLLLQAADKIVDFGPGAGDRGGKIVYSGKLDHVSMGHTLTGRYLSGELTISGSGSREIGSRGWIRLFGARGRNLCIDCLKVPLQNIVGISGVSGSGKSSLVRDTLCPILAASIGQSQQRPLPYDSCDGKELINRIVVVDQRPIGRNSRSNAATYTGVWGPLRQLFSELPTALMRGYTPSHFSFNSTVGSCEKCSGAGSISGREGKSNLGSVVCAFCAGRRYKREIVDVKYRGFSIADVLEFKVDEALEFFSAIPEVARRLQVLSDIGLGYLGLGQPATSLSGGEAQRIKLAAELGRPRHGETLYVLDEPTSGLHMQDVLLLLSLLQRLVDEGNTVLFIEHHLELLAAVDWLIDIGPDAGSEGGKIVAEGIPQEVAEVESSHTGRCLKEFFEKDLNDNS